EVNNSQSQDFSPFNIESPIEIEKKDIQLALGTGYMTMGCSWRIPCLVQGVPPLAVLISVIFRWLFAKGRSEEA
ncbi:hypothetical protein N7495_005229, partial [Penicillium taxi]|uniref:uncharacterized protein n=1 Tax=Penicillium taxi TaxID=168475 RepID=UPI002545A030